VCEWTARSLAGGKTEEVSIDCDHFKNQQMFGGRDGRKACCCNQVTNDGIIAKRSGAR